VRPARVVVVFAKRPEPGAVKTRMCPPLSPEEAALLYAAMLDDVLDTTAQAARRAQAHTWLVVHPPEATGEMAASCPPGFRVQVQRGAGLAARMAHAVASAAAAGYERILLRGSDSPALPVHALVAGFEALERADLAVGPDRDGGYGWIALRRPVPGLFDHPMSTSSVLADTLSNARAKGLCVEMSDPHFDLDTVDDLTELAEVRRAGVAGSCPRTLALLDARGLWPRAVSARSQGRSLPRN
jgi:rSAM/selenodomain-associated transferase 1